jgi:hypothetical protein
MSRCASEPADEAIESWPLDKTSSKTDAETDCVIGCPNDSSKSLSEVRSGIANGLKFVPLQALSTGSCGNAAGCAIASGPAGEGNMASDFPASDQRVVFTGSYNFQVREIEVFEITD